ncbi:MAG: arsenate reductase [Chlamydiales bacterium]|jgi:arsenate reductase
MSSSEKRRVLFLCTGNSCRSQMAEGWLRALAGERFECLSAGTAPQGINPRAVAAMEACGIDISGQVSQHIDEFLAAPPDLVVTVCDHAAESCPTFPGTTDVVHWPFPDPAHAQGSEAEIAAEFAAVRDAIRERLEEWLGGITEPG